MLNAGGDDHYDEAVDNLALYLMVLLFWGSAVVVCHRDRKSALRFLPLFALGCSVGARVLGFSELAAVCAGLSAALLMWTSGNTSPSLIPLVPIFPVLTIAIGVGLNWVLSWLGTILLTVVHALGLFLERRPTVRGQSSGASGRPTSPGAGEEP